MDPTRGTVAVLPGVATLTKKKHTAAKAEERPRLVGSRPAFPTTAANMDTDMPKRGKPGGLRQTQGQWASRRPSQRRQRRSTPTCRRGAGGSGSRKEPSAQAPDPRPPWRTSHRHCSSRQCTAQTRRCPSPPSHGCYRPPCGRPRCLQSAAR